jgi:pimeloyl-ACP methyl ester carboxylesterase
MQYSLERQAVRFTSGGFECAAWHYSGANDACIVMAGGFAVTKEPATDQFAARFHQAGFSVLAFDYRRLGESGGAPRQVVRIKDQLDDWQAAIQFAATLPGVDSGRIAAWGFSASGGHIFNVAARRVEAGGVVLAAAIAQTPNADGVVATRNAAKYQKPWALARFTGRAAMDAVGSLVGARPRLVDLTGAPGAVAVLTTPDSADGEAALNPGNRYPDWLQAVSARSALRLAFYRPGRSAARITGPLLVVVADQDQSALPGPAVEAARRAPRGELVRMPGGHYTPFLGEHEFAVAAELEFLARTLLNPGSATG